MVQPVKLSTLAPDTFNKFLRDAQAEGGGKLRVSGSGDNAVLYVSRKGSGTGLANLFGRIDKRRDDVAMALTTLLDRHADSWLSGARGESLHKLINASHKKDISVASLLGSENVPLNGNTTFDQIDRLIADAPADAKLRVGRSSEGVDILYVSKKGGGTGLKNFLGLLDKRRSDAAHAIAQLLDTRVGTGTAGNAAAGALSATLTSSADLKVSEVRASILSLATLERLPEGMKLDRETGVFKGSQSITHVPDPPGQGMKLFQLDRHVGKSISDFFKDLATGLDKEAGKGVLEGVSVPKSSEADIKRYPFTIGSQQSKPNDASHFENVVKELKNLAGCENPSETGHTVGVLLALCTQNTLLKLPNLVTQQDGAAATYLRSAQNGDLQKAGTLSIYPDGVAAELNHDPKTKLISQTGTSSFELQKTTTGFDIKVSMQGYLAVEEDRRADFPLEPNSLLMADYSFTLSVDGAAARQGKLELSCANGVQIALSGKLNTNPG